MQIEVKDLCYVYNKGTANETTAVKDISFHIEGGSFVGLIGHTGSGKSTLIQMLNALLTPTSGKVLVDGKDIFESKTSIKDIRFNVGLVFQYPEHQLFEMNIFDEVAFGPKNMGLDEEETRARVDEALSIVGIDESMKEMSPITMSGGQKRRIAIAGILAMRPKVIILDEPTAGLDPRGRKEILDKIKTLQKEENLTVILVSHNMNEVASYCDKVLVMDKGELIEVGTPKEVFKKIEMLERVGLSAPYISYLVRELRDKGFDIDEEIISVDECKISLLKELGNKS